MQLKDLFENKIKDLISLIDENSKDENDWIITEGIICKILLLIRKKIREILHLPSNKNLNRRKNRRIMQEEVRNKFTKKVHIVFDSQDLVAMIEFLVQLNLIENPSTKIRNKIANIETNIINTLRNLPKDISEKLFPNASMDDINSFLNENEERRKLKLDWFRGYIDKTKKM